MSIEIPDIGFAGWFLSAVVLAVGAVIVHAKLGGVKYDVYPDTDTLKDTFK